MLPVLFLKVEFENYRNSDPLRDFDPLQDWLLSKQSYLTWREWGQRLIGGAYPYAFLSSNEPGFVFQHLPLKDEESDSAWMELVMANRRRGKSDYEPSMYQGAYGWPVNQTISWDPQRLPRELATINSAVMRRIGGSLDNAGDDIEHVVSPSPMKSYLMYHNGQIASLHTSSKEHMHQIWDDILTDLVETFKEAQVEGLKTSSA
jgi:hypothetical protein